jgi:nitrous oxide reductase accessory protein NosL
MQKILFVFLLLFTLLGAHENMQTFNKKPLFMPKNFRAVPITKATILQSGKAKMFCPKCGMNLPMFYRTNHAATVDGKVMQFCSMHCLIEAMQNSKEVKDIKVVDNSTLKFIDAKKAFYVVGSSKPATMSKVSKYAFATKKAALEFAKKYGGEVMDFKQALNLAKKEFEADSKLIKMRQAKMAKKGEKIYKQKCKAVDKKFTSIAEAKAYIVQNKICPDLKGKALQAVGIYLKNR